MLCLRVVSPYLITASSARVELSVVLPLCWGLAGRPGLAVGRSPGDPKGDPNAKSDLAGCWEPGAGRRPVPGRSQGRPQCKCQVLPSRPCGRRQDACGREHARCPKSGWLGRSGSRSALGPEPPHPRAFCHRCAPTIILPRHPVPSLWVPGLPRGRGVFGGSRISRTLHTTTVQRGAPEACWGCWDLYTSRSRSPSRKT